LVGRSVWRLDLQSVARRVHGVDSSNLSDGFKPQSIKDPQASKYAANE
jgi:hypothetical protein